MNTGSDLTMKDAGSIYDDTYVATYNIVFEPLKDALVAASSPKPTVEIVREVLRAQEFARPLSEIERQAQFEAKVDAITDAISHSARQLIDLSDVGSFVLALEDSATNS